MRQGQFISIFIALSSGAVAFLGMRSLVSAPPRASIQIERTETVPVLVARADMPLGHVAHEDSFRWQDWPVDALSGALVTRREMPAAAKEFSGAIARSPILAGEPINGRKLIRGGSGGVLAAMLPPGMRAVSTKITEYTAAGKLILPNDRVDVILIRRVRGRQGQDEHISEMLLRNVRVLAIGQQIEPREGRKGSEGNVATLELAPRQAELLALGNAMGEISLALRSAADLASVDAPATTDDLEARDRNSGIRVLRYGVRSRGYGVN